jgi:hypothetical protein
MQSQIVLSNWQYSPNQEWHMSKEMREGTSFKQFYE